MGIFAVLLGLAIVLLCISIRSGGAAQALNAAGIGWNRAEAGRIGAVALMLLAYIAGLVPRVDFILASALLITALICGFHGRGSPRALVPLLAIGGAGAYALLSNPSQADWGQTDDDWVALSVLAALTLWHQTAGGRSAGGKDRAVRLTPLLAIGVPLILVCAMAFGFRQNVPARSGLVFAKIEYTYYVHLRPLWRS